MPTWSTGAAAPLPPAARISMPRPPPRRAGWKATTTTPGWPRWWPPAARTQPDNPRHDTRRRKSGQKEIWMYAVSKAMPLDATAEESKQQILDLVRDFTLETTRSEEHTSELQSLMRISYA